MRNRLNVDGAGINQRQQNNDSDDSVETQREKDDTSLTNSFHPADSAPIDETKVEMLQERMHDMRQSVVDDLNNRLNEMVSDTVQQLRSHIPKLNGYPKDSPSNKGKGKDGALRPKKFVARNSYLTDLFEINHFRTIYNIFIVMLLILFLNTAVHDFMEKGSTHVGLRTIQLGFGKFTSAILIWLLMMSSTFVTYLGFFVWSHKYPDFAPKSLSRKAWNYVCLLAFIMHQIAFIVVPTKIILEEVMPPASSMMVLMEQVRMLMKTHAFVRSSAPRILAQKAKDEDYRGSECPVFSKFLYFMFVPTLIYRDEYPRTNKIRWRVVFWNFAEVVMVVFYVAFIFERFLMPPFEKYGPQILKPETVILTIFSTMLPGLIMFLFGFYCVLHSWQNGMAELLRFADRLFYKDWWNCTSYNVYYRIWNIPVHDWLHCYIYKDMYETLHNKVIATLTVFLVSAAFHEYILAFTFRFFYPVMLIMFGGFGLLLVFITKNYSKVDGNIFIWWTLFTGNGILFTLYSMEYYARRNCPPYEGLNDLFVPRSWGCHNLIAEGLS